MFGQEAVLYKFLKEVQTTVDKNSTDIKNKIAYERKNVLNLNVLIGLDVSGSIGNEQFKQFMKQVNHIRGTSSVKVGEIDTRLVALYDYFINAQNEIVRISGGSGTEFLEFFEMAQQMKPDAIIFLTDGQVSEDDIESVNSLRFDIPTGWILTHNGVVPYEFGVELFKLPNI